MIIAVAGLEKESVVDGEGIRFVVFVQGCPHQCKGCHNPDTWDMTKKSYMEIESIYDIMDRINNGAIQYKGLTLSGGEPFCQPYNCSCLADKAHSLGWDVWCYSGYTYEELMKIKETDENVRLLLSKIDVLIDGPFIEELKDLDLVYRGSSNQRVIRMRNGEMIP